MSDLCFRKTQEHSIANVPTNTSQEAQVSRKTSSDIAKNTASDHQIITSRSILIARISSLFSTSLNEARDIRNTPLSVQETGMRFEELIDNLRLIVLKMIGDFNEIS